MPRMKETFAVVKLTTEGAEILQKFFEREDAAKNLKDRRDAIPDQKEKYTVAMLPLDAKGNYLLPP